MAHPRDYSPLGWRIRDRIEAEGREPTRGEGIDYLTADGPDRACVSMYGATSGDCARAAWQITHAIARAAGKPITFDAIDESMESIVDEGDDVRSIVARHRYV
jgi:hypothetical protein